MITLPFHAPEGYRPALSTDALEGYWFVYREDKLLIHRSEEHTSELQSH